MAFEIIESPQSVSPKGSFQTKSDQTKFRSAFFPEGTGPEASVMSQDGRVRLGFTEFVSETGKNRNIVSVPQMTGKMKEYIVPIEDARKFDQHAAALSLGRVEECLRENRLDPTPTQVGVISGGTQSNETVFKTPQP